MQIEKIFFGHTFNAASQQRALLYQTIICSIQWGIWQS